ncbi:unnamed protein product, partial [Rotaria magnacalcarata]
IAHKLKRLEHTYGSHKQITSHYIAIFQQNPPIDKFTDSFILNLPDDAPISKVQKRS